MASTAETIHRVDKRRIDRLGTWTFVLAMVFATSDVSLANSSIDITERNFACYGEKTRILLTGSQGEDDIQLDVPTEYFGHYDIYMEDVRGHLGNGSKVPDLWSHCAKQPIRQTTLQILLKDRDLSLDGTALASFQREGLRLVAISPGPWRLRDGNMHYNEGEKPKLRQWFNTLRQQPGKLEKTNGFEHMRKDANFPESVLPEIYFSEPGLAEPLTGEPIIFNCQQWTVFNQRSANVCQVTYLLPGRVGIYYEFVRQAISQDQWSKLDLAMRTFAVAMFKDSNLKSKAFGLEDAQ